MTYFILMSEQFSLPFSKWPISQHIPMYNKCWKFDLMTDDANHRFTRGYTWGLRTHRPYCVIAVLKVLIEGVQKQFIKKKGRIRESKLREKSINDAQQRTRRSSLPTLQGMLSIWLPFRSLLQKRSNCSPHPKSRGTLLVAGLYSSPQALGSGWSYSFPSLPFSWPSQETPPPTAPGGDYRQMRQNPWLVFPSFNFTLKFPQRTLLPQV